MNKYLNKNDGEIIDYLDADIPPCAGYSQRYKIDDESLLNQHQENSIDGLGYRLFESLANIGEWIIQADNFIIYSLLILIGLFILPIGLFFIICIICHYYGEPDNRITIIIGTMLFTIGIILIILTY